jgi:hypothetical protein
MSPLQRLHQRLPSATAPAAVGSLVSLLAQGVFALFLLKLFDAQAVGMFSVVSQIAFCWATLALAQSPVSLLADHLQAPRHAAHTAWRQSAWRMVWLSPFMALALYWTQRHSASAPLSHADMGTFGHALLWASSIAAAQMSWLLAQNLSLRAQGPLAIALVRLLPPVLAVGVAWVGTQWLGQTQATVLLMASLLGYAIGALWLVPACHPKPRTGPAHQSPSDPRSTRLKILHTLTDVLCSTALAIQWQALYGPAEAGCLLVLLRVFGFVPALVHTAWAQALISRPHEHKLSSLWVSLAACGVIALLGLSLEAALHWQLLQPSWHQLSLYIWPLALWQMAACLSAAHAHLPFWQGHTRQLSLQSMGINAVMVCLLLVNQTQSVNAAAHLQWIAGFMALALTLQTLEFLKQQSPRQN